MPIQAAAKIWEAATGFTETVKIIRTWKEWAKKVVSKEKHVFPYHIPIFSTYSSTQLQYLVLLGVLIGRWACERLVCTTLSRGNFFVSGNGNHVLTVIRSRIPTKIRGLSHEVQCLALQRLEIDRAFVILRSVIAVQHATNVSLIC